MQRLMKSKKRIESLLWNTIQIAIRPKKAKKNSRKSPKPLKCCPMRKNVKLMINSVMLRLNKEEWVTQAVLLVVKVDHLAEVSMVRLVIPTQQAVREDLISEDFPIHSISLSSFLGEHLHLVTANDDLHTH